MKLFKFFVGLIILGIFTMFATANTHKVPVFFLMENQSLIGYTDIQTKTSVETDSEMGKAPRSIPVFLMVYCTFVIGFLTSSVLTVGMHRSLRRQLKRSERTLQECEKSLSKLQTNETLNSQSSDLESGSLPIRPN